MSNNPLGKLIHGEAQRDAVHVAILPVTAAERLAPGSEVRFVKGYIDRVEAVTDGDQMAIVDPFLQQAVEPEQRCYICLYPNTVIGMRHHWSHPGIPDERSSVGQPSESDYEIIRDVAESCMVSARTLMDAARQYAETGDSWCVGNNEEYWQVSQHEWDRFWQAFKNITGIDTRNTGGHPFSCAC